MNSSKLQILDPCQGKYWCAYAFWTEGTSVRLLKIRRSYKANQDRLALHTNSCCLASNNTGQYCNSSLRQRETIEVMTSMWAANVSTCWKWGLLTYFEWNIAEERFVPNHWTCRATIRDRSKACTNLNECRKSSTWQRVRDVLLPKVINWLTSRWSFAIESICRCHWTLRATSWLGTWSFLRGPWSNWLQLRWEPCRSSQWDRRAKSKQTSLEPGQA